jgi:very-short-patch-repair endonuclease/predicted transcriptional regulator of viral defense system
MAPEREQARDKTLRSARAWRLARRQHGTVARRHLLELGFTDEAIEHRARKGRLHRIYRGVYAVGRAELRQRGQWMAALLACGDDSYLSHRSAAALYGIGKERGCIEVSVTRSGQHRLRGVKAHRRPSLASHELGTLDRIPVTSPVRTLLDYAILEPPNRVERAVNEADKCDVIDPDALRKALNRSVGEPGVKRLRKVLDRHTFRLSDQELELLFRPIAANAGIPVELTKVILNDFEVDFFWPSLGLVVETDGWRYHRTPSAQTRDALRFQLHTAAGLTPIRFSHWQVKYEPEHVRGILERTAARLQSNR